VGDSLVEDIEVKCVIVLEFREWYIQASKDPHFYPLVPGIKPTDWYSDHIRFKATDNMWEMWHIYHAYKNKYYIVW
jgi:hypothetical protein